MNQAAAVPAGLLAALPAAAAAACRLGGCETLGIGGDEEDNGTPTSATAPDPVAHRQRRAADPALANVAVVLPPAQTNAEWPQAGGNAAKAPAT
jgi:hypothetical protein